MEWDYLDFSLCGRIKIEISRQLRWEKSAMAAQHQSIMQHVLAFLEKAAEGEWGMDFAIEQWKAKENEDAIKEIIPVLQNCLVLFSQCLACNHSKSVESTIIHGELFTKLKFCVNFGRKR